MRNKSSTTSPESQDQTIQVSLFRPWMQELRPRGLRLSFECLGGDSEVTESQGSFRGWRLGYRRLLKRISYKSLLQKTHPWVHWTIRFHELRNWTFSHVLPLRVLWSTEAFSVFSEQLTRRDCCYMTFLFCCILALWVEFSLHRVV